MTQVEPKLTLRLPKKDLFKIPEEELDDEMNEILPLGGGFDTRYECFKPTARQIECHGAFHMMDKHGYYADWQKFKVVIGIRRFDKLRILKGPCEGLHQVLFRRGDYWARVKSVDGWCKSNVAYGLRDYIEETINHHLSDYLHIRDELIKA